MNPAHRRCHEQARPGRRAGRGGRFYCDIVRLPDGSATRLKVCISWPGSGRARRQVIELYGRLDSKHAQEVGKRPRS